MTDSNEKKSGADAPVETHSYSRRDVVKTGGSAVTLGMLAAAFGATLPKGVRAAESAQGVNALTILYPAGEGLTFNADYYRDHHLKMIMKLYGNTIQRFELRKVNAPPAGAAAPPPPPAGAPAPPPRYAAAINIWINDLDAFNANNQKHGKTMTDDVPNFTNAKPIIQYDKVHGEMGAKRSAPKLGDTCLTILYPNSDGVRWDVDYYKKGHMPLIMRLYGEKAIKRFELRKGDSGMGGGKPAYIGSVNIYINEQAAFDAAGKQHGKTLQEDVPHFSSVM
ncbi:MAG TPA: EthD family reductase, partial [Steroidobacteraceae bacterium]|nr:EthD family reductase [Steroidobacteraceae bacterium]